LTTAIIEDESSEVRDDEPTEIPMEDEPTNVTMENDATEVTMEDEPTEEYPDLSLFLRQLPLLALHCPLPDEVDLASGGHPVTPGVDWIYRVDFIEELLLHPSYSYSFCISQAKTKAVFSS